MPMSNRISQARSSAPLLAALAAQTLLCLAQVAAQPARGPKFEVASVKPSIFRQPVSAGGGQRAGGGGCTQSLKVDPGRVDIECATLITLIGYAYRFSPDRISGPDWIASPGSPRFDIAARLPPGASANQVPEMLQALLSERFQLALRRGTAVQAIYALVIAKGGLMAKPAAPFPATAAEVADALSSPAGFYGGTETRTTRQADGGYTTISNPRMGTVRQTDGPNWTQRWEAPSTTMEGLADLLTQGPPQLPLLFPISHGGYREQVP